MGLNPVKVKINYQQLIYLTFLLAQARKYMESEGLTAKEIEIQVSGIDIQVSMDNVQFK